MALPMAVNDVRTHYIIMIISDAISGYVLFRLK